MVSLFLSYYQYISIIINCCWQVAFTDSEVFKKIGFAVVSLCKKPLTSGDEPSAFELDAKGKCFNSVLLLLTMWFMSEYLLGQWSCEWGILQDNVWIHWQRGRQSFQQVCPDNSRDASNCWNFLNMKLNHNLHFFFSSSFSLSLPESLVSLLNKKYFKSIFIKYVVACLRNNKILLVFFRRQSKLKCGKIPYLQVSVSRSACFLWDLKNLGSTSRGPCRGPLLDFL